MTFQLIVISMMQPKIISGLTAETGEAIEFINKGAGLKCGLIKHVMTELSHTNLHFNLGRDAGPLAFL